MRRLVIDTSRIGTCAIELNNLGCLVYLGRHNNNRMHKYKALS